MMPWEDGKEEKSVYDEELDLAYKQLGQLYLQKKQIEEQEVEIDFKIRAILSTKPLRDFEERTKSGSEEAEERPAENS
tara:strand:+ start:72 stop:305 length:234 start_codon:yes stop_codon:yes gene_type:complete